MDAVIVDGDLAEFEPAFGPATVTVRPGPITGSGPATWKGRRMCVEGDEASVVVPGCPYQTAAYPVIGLGTLTIQQLGADQPASKSRTGGKALVLKGQRFVAKFSVTTPAQQPNPPGPNVPDPAPSYMGQGRFTTTNQTYRGT